MPRALLPLLLAACAPPEGTPTFDDEGTPTDTDSDADVAACEGPLVVDWTRSPEAFTTDPTSWEQDGVRFLVTSYGEPEPGLPSFIVSRDASGCLLLEPGALAIDTTASGCAAKRVTLDVTDRCGGGCTRVVAGANDEVVASTSNSRTGVAEQLALRPASPFNVLGVASLAVTVCKVELGLAPLPEALQPPDTGADF